MNCDMEYFSYGPFMSSITLEQLQYISYRILGALRYLHSASIDHFILFSNVTKDIAHRDIQCSSILANTSSEKKMSERKILSVKLASFNQAAPIKALHNDDNWKLPNPSYNLWQWVFVF